MNDNEIVSGQRTAWSLLKKLAEGDAGEVYSVQSLTGEQTAILKRPCKSAFAGDVARQAAQIRAEGKILAALASLPRAEPDLQVCVPMLLDVPKPSINNHSSDFIIIEPAPGFDLSLLGRVAQLGMPDRESLPESLSLEESALLQGIADQRQVPARVLLTILLRMLDFLQRIHGLHVTVQDEEIWGIAWNDVKTAHIFWDPMRSRLTLIDWGNAQVLEADGTTRDRKCSWVEDFRQLFDEIGRYLMLVAPGLPDRIHWPATFSVDAASSAGIEALKANLVAALLEEEAALTQARQAETALLQGKIEGEDALAQLEAIQQHLQTFGELPDYASQLNFTSGLASRLAAEDQLEALHQLCSWANRLPSAEADIWSLVEALAHIPGRSEGEERQHFLDAIQFALCQDWEALVWSLLEALQAYPEPDWWTEVISLIRERALGPQARLLRPLVALHRLYYTLRATAQRYQDNPSLDPASEREILWGLAERLKAEVLPNWSLIDPGPPHSGLRYKGVEAILEEAEDFFPEETRAARMALAHPMEQAERVLEAWQDQDFLAASRGLRLLALWDPDRRRALTAQAAIEVAPGWLKGARIGPQEGEHFPDWITHLEARGRELRNQVGPAEWLNEVLDACRQIRRGAWPGDLLVEEPGLLRELPWLRGFEREERVGEVEGESQETESLPAYGVEGDKKELDSSQESTGTVSHAVSTEQGTAAQNDMIGGQQNTPSLPPTPLRSGGASLRSAIPQNDERSRGGVSGVVAGRVGPGNALAFLEPLDAWLPEARGSSARVLLGQLQLPSGVFIDAAIKLMRMELVDYSLPLFREEVQILNIMKDVPGVTRMLECGFIQLEPEAQLPLDSNVDHDPAQGKILRIGVDSTQEFLDRLKDRIEAGWIPYLALIRERQADSMMLMCDAGMTRGQFLPVLTLLKMAIQICDILEVAHARRIVYRDHKILHYYWQPKKNGIFLIDWNVARLHPEGLAAAEIHMDLVQFAARGLHHILTGRAAPGALPLGPTRPEEIEQSAQSYQAQWTYDDQRLPEGLRKVLERALAGEFTSAKGLRDELKRTMMQLR